MKRRQLVATCALVLSISALSSCSTFTTKDTVATVNGTKISADAHVFARLAEGQPVRYADDQGGLLGGKLVEKCRYGALVVRDDGAVVAVGFRKLWPAASAGAA